MTTPKKSPEVLQSEALTVLVQWRGADRRAIESKSFDAKKVEYKMRNNLRTAADNLTGVKHGN